jgi:hypothetical protein
MMIGIGVIAMARWTTLGEAWRNDLKITMSSVSNETNRRSRPSDLEPSFNHAKER